MSMVPPGIEHSIARGSRRIFFADRKQFSSNQPPYGALHRTLRNSHALRHFLITGLHLGISTLLFGSKPEINKKTNRSSVVTDEVADEYVDYVIVERKHRYIIR